MTRNQYSAIIHCIQWIGFNIMAMVAVTVWIKWLFLAFAAFNMIAFLWTSGRTHLEMGRN